MTNQIIHLAVHDLIRKDGKFAVELSQGTLTIGVTAQRIVDELHTIYSRRSSKSFGKFSSNENDYPAQKYLIEYTSAKKRDFAALTTHMMTTLSIQASQKS